MLAVTSWTLGVLGASGGPKGEDLFVWSVYEKLCNSINVQCEHPHLPHTKLVLGSQRVGDARQSTAKLVFGRDPEDVLFPLDKFADWEAVALQCGSDGDPAHFFLVVLLFQNVVQDLAATVVLGRLPVAYD